MFLCVCNFWKLFTGCQIGSRNRRQWGEWRIVHTTWSRNACRELCNITSNSVFFDFYKHKILLLRFCCNKILCLCMFLASGHTMVAHSPKEDVWRSKKKICHEYFDVRKYTKTYHKSNSFCVFVVRFHFCVNKKMFVLTESIWSDEPVQPHALQENCQHPS